MDSGSFDEKIVLSCPHLGGEEQDYIATAFESNWIGPLGPNVKGFEEEVASYVGVKKAVAMSSGTAAIHIALNLLNIQRDDLVFVSSLTFIASVNPVLYQKATPVFIDSEPDTWNMSPQALNEALVAADKNNKLPKAVIVVDLFGMPAAYDELQALCDRYGVPLIADSAESVGAEYKDRKCGSLGQMAAFSFNGNKIITSGGGGMLLSNDEKAMERALYLITQARMPASHYEHTEVGFNYRLSNILAGIGRGQMKVLDQRVQRRREIFEIYKTELAGCGLEFFAEPTGARSNRWLSSACLEDKVPMTSLQLNEYLNEKNIESRPVWKPMHQQPLFKDCSFYIHEGWRGKSVADWVFDRGISLPSATQHDDSVFKQVAGIIKRRVQNQ